VGRCGGGQGGLMGRWAERVREVSFSFFSFLNPFQIKPFELKIQIKLFKLFHRIFINFLNFTQATKIHAKTNNDAQTLVVSRLI
jgi:hypothetical protein